MPLKSETIDWIFARMGVRYGALWAAKWNGIPMEAVSADWARELDGMPREALHYAMGFLPADYPPTVAQFKATCLRAPDRSLPALAAPPADPARVASVIGGLRDKLARNGPRAWAYALQEREKRGDRLTIFQRFAWREALRTAPIENVATFQMIDPECLPPAMRPSDRERA